MHAWSSSNANVHPLIQEARLLPVMETRPETGGRDQSLQDQD